MPRRQITTEYKANKSRIGSGSGYINDPIVTIGSEANNEVKNSRPTRDNRS